MLARDGDTTVGAGEQLAQVPPDATHVVISAGGNNALMQIDALTKPATSTLGALDHLAAIARKFATDYEGLVLDAMKLDRHLLLCTVYDAVPGLPAGLRTALALFNDAILRVAIQFGLPVLDLRQVCTDAADYSVVSPIEPSVQGGTKIAAAVLAAVTDLSSDIKFCRVYRGA